jgi:GNAT superfamily N-acetyltransferase
VHRKPLVVDVTEALRASGNHPLVAHLSASAPSPPRYWVCGRAVALADDYWDEVNLSAVGPVPDVMAIVEGLADLDAWMSVPTVAAEAIPEDLLADRHEWAFRWTTRPTGTPRDAAAWLSHADDADVSALLAEGFPDASVTVGHRRAHRWAGIRDARGRLLACAVDATEEPSVGFVASITTRPDARGRGLGTLVTGWLVDRLVEEHGRAALWVHQDNLAARLVYDRLGMVDLPMTAGALRGAQRALA